MTKLKLSISIEQDLVEEIDRVAKATGENRSQVMERLCNNALAGSDWDNAGMSLNDFFREMSKPGGMKLFAKIIEKERKKSDATKTLPKSNRTVRKPLITLNSQNLPPRAKWRSKRIPKDGRRVVCTHCSRVFSSDEFLWDGENWVCPTGTCNGSSYGCGIIDADDEQGRGYLEQMGLE
ncbi:CopG family transcriptional regulator [Planctomycetales bacterium ZRK34]|nr:CopG family transcriptional regulator [Planctomycetales bacterium ZRK34]